VQPTYRDHVEIDHQGETPIYQQLAEILRARIASGELAVGRPIPSEETLAQQYGVARLTARKAVGLLRGEGLVKHVTGRGTFVQPPAE
jgi:GntR family transcriptional regulator